MNFFQTLEAHLNLIPVITTAIQTLQQIGHTKESAVQKVGQIIETSAAVGESIPVPVVSSVSALVEDIAQAIFGNTAPTTPPAAQ